LLPLDKFASRLILSFEECFLLDTLLSYFARYGYLVVFFGVMLENAGLPVPGETILLAAGFFAAQGHFHLWTVMAVAAFGAMLGDNAGYVIGHKIGRIALERYGRYIRLTPKRLARLEGFFARHGNKTILFARFVTGLRVFAALFAGAARMRWRTFALYNLAGAVLWAIVITLLGFFFGQSWGLLQHWIGRASEIVGLAVLVVIILALIWRWLSGHEDWIKGRLTALLGHPRVAAFRRRYGSQIAFLQARLSPQGYLGLHLTIGSLVLIVSAWFFGSITQDVMRGDPLAVIDLRVSEWLHARMAPSLTTAIMLITQLGSPVFVSCATLLIAVLLWRRRQVYEFVMLVLAVFGGMLLNVLLKTAFHRHRPGFYDPFLSLTNYSFPSGHTMAATVFYGVLAAFAVRNLRDWRWQVLAVLLAGLMILLIGFSRVYLGAHYLSDVLAASAEGLAWLALSLTAVETIRRRRSQMLKTAATQEPDTKEQDA
jgi:undecaprenyl-diphosphatase